MASEIAKKYAERLTITMPADDTHAGEVDEIADEIDAACLERCKPLVEAVLAAAERSRTHCKQEWEFAMHTIEAEARKLKGGE